MIIEMDNQKYILVMEKKQKLFLKIIMNMFFKNLSNKIKLFFIFTIFSIIIVIK